MLRSPNTGVRQNLSTIKSRDGFSSLISQFGFAFDGKSCVFKTDVNRNVVECDISHQVIFIFVTAIFCWFFYSLSPGCELLFVFLLSEFVQKLDDRKKYELERWKCRLYTDLQTEPIGECRFLYAYNHLCRGLINIGSDKTVLKSIQLCPLKVIMEKTLD